MIVQSIFEPAEESVGSGMEGNFERIVDRELSGEEVVVVCRGDGRSDEGSGGERSGVLECVLPGVRREGLDGRIGSAGVDVVIHRRESERVVDKERLWRNDSEGAEGFRGDREWMMGELTMSTDRLILQLPLELVLPSSVR